MSTMGKRKDLDAGCGQQAKLTSFFNKKNSPSKEELEGSSSKGGEEGKRTSIEEWDSEWMEGTGGLTWEKGRKSFGGGGGEPNPDQESQKAMASVGIGGGLGREADEAGGEPASPLSKEAVVGEDMDVAGGSPYDDVVEMAEAGDGGDGGVAHSEKDGGGAGEGDVNGDFGANVPDRGKVRDVWNNHHVKLPCSKHYVFRDGGSRWEVIQRSLAYDIKCFHDLKRCILSYSFENGSTWKFTALQALLEQHFDDKQRANFFNSVLPGIVKFAMLLPQVCPSPIPLLLQGRSKLVQLTQLQTVSLLACAFLCLFPRVGRESRLPSINFFDLFDTRIPSRIGQNVEKLKCIVEYFDRMGRRRDAGDSLSRQIELHRRFLGNDAVEWTSGGGGNVSLKGGLQWQTSQKEFGAVSFRALTKEMIEDFDPSGEVWQADFANKYIGGGVLGSGCVQEEIRFVLSPELLISRLLAPEMLDLETILITGTERFCNYTGYAHTFKYVGRHEDKAALHPGGGRLQTSVICFDAIYFSGEDKQRQLERMPLIRELNKALCAFLPPCAFPRCSTREREGELKSPAIATGNWGCGAFGGDKVVKGLIQMLAATQAERDLLYMTFGDEALTKQLQELHALLVETKTTVSRLVDILMTSNCSTGDQLVRLIESKLV